MSDDTLRADLASTVAGGGASLVGFVGGGTVQDSISVVTTSAAGIATLTIPTAITAFNTTDRGAARWSSVPSGTGTLPASGNGKWWTADAGGRRWWITSDLTSQALGAVRDGVTNDIAVIKELVEIAGPYFKKPVYISPGIHAIVRTTAADVIYVPAAGHIIFQAQAKLKGTVNIGASGYYLPFFAVVQKTGAIIEGANDKQFVFTGRLTYGAGQDFPAADITGAISDKRLGTSADVRADTYASGVAVLSSHSVKLLGLGCENVDGASVTLGPAFVHGFISSSGNCNDLWYDNIDVDDVVLGCAIQGGDGGGYGGFIRGGRMSQDIGIPGHVRYDFRRNCTFGATVDTGEETGADLTVQISHTVSCAGSGPTAFGPIVSRRRQGALNVKNITAGATFSGITWIPVALRPGGSEILPEQPRVYGVTGLSNSGICIDGMVLNSDGADVILLGGDFGKGAQIEGILIRNDVNVPTYGYIGLGASPGRHFYKCKLVQKGNVDPPISVHCGGIHTDSSLALDLVGFIDNAPKVQVANGSAYLTRCVFTINARYDVNGSLNPHFGDPSAVWVGATDDNARARNVMMYPDGWSRWQKTVSAGTSYSVRFPIQTGSSEAKVSIISSLYTMSSYFEHIEHFEIIVQRTMGRGGSPATGVASKGVVAGLNNTAYTVGLSPSLGYCDVSGTITGSAPQGSTSIVQFGSRLLGGNL